MDKILEKKGFICDMDGVIYHGNKILDGVKEFVNWMLENDKKFVFLTNSPERTPHELSMKLERMGLSVSADHFYTSAMATAEFLSSQAPGCTAYVIGEAAFAKALYDHKIYMNDINPDYVVIGETRTYSFEKIEKAIELVNKGRYSGSYRKRHYARNRLAYSSYRNSYRQESIFRWQAKSAYASSRTSHPWLPQR